MSEQHGVAHDERAEHEQPDVTVDEYVEEHARLPVDERRDDLSDDGGPDEGGLDDERPDEDVDAELDGLDDGSAVLGGRYADSGPGALPLLLAAREHFAGLGELEVTGDARVDAATARLEEVPDLPTADHVAVYDDVHRRLQDALSDADVR